MDDPLERKLSRMHTSIDSLTWRRLWALGAFLIAAAPVWAQTPTMSGQQSASGQKIFCFQNDRGSHTGASRRRIGAQGLRAR